MILALFFDTIFERIELESWDWSQIGANFIWNTCMSIEFILSRFVWKWHRKTGLVVNQLYEKFLIFQQEDFFSLACFEGYKFIWLMQILHRTKRQYICCIEILYL